MHACMCVHVCGCVCACVCVCKHTCMCVHVCVCVCVCVHACKHACTSGFQSCTIVCLSQKSYHYHHHCHPICVLTLDSERPQLGRPLVKRHGSDADSTLVCASVRLHQATDDQHIGHSVTGHSFLHFILSQSTDHGVVLVLNVLITRNVFIEIHMVPHDLERTNGP